MRRVHTRVYTLGVNVSLTAAILSDLKLPFHYEDDPYDRLGRLIPQLDFKDAHVFLQEIRNANKNDTRIVLGFLQPKKKKTPKAMLGSQKIYETPPRVQRGRDVAGVSPLKIVGKTTSKTHRP